VVTAITASRMVNAPQRERDCDGQKKSSARDWAVNHLYLSE
jgi:hypothetical protein